MKVGFHSPLPPDRTGVADYSAALLHALRQLGEVEVAAAHADIHLYHVGNNQLHREIYRRAIAQPGVTVLHDAVLQHFFLGSLSEQEYVDEFVYNYGEWNRSQGQRLWRDRGASASDGRFFRYPMLRRIVDVSRAVIVHNGGAAEMVRKHAPDARIAVIPHLFDPPPAPDPFAVMEFRNSLGIPYDGCLFGIFGFLRESKRVLEVLTVFERLRAAAPKVALLIAGDFVSTDLERACGPLLSLPGVHRVPYLTERDFWVAAAAIDVCINLRVPAAGETSGIAVRMMGLGKPVLLTDAAEATDFPAGSFLPVPAGVAERSTLFDYLGILALNRVMRLDIGHVAAGHILRNHSLGRVAGLYWDTLCNTAGSSSSVR